MSLQVFIAPATGEVRKLEIASFHDSGIPVGKAFTFTVLTHRARGHLEAKVLDTIDATKDSIDPSRCWLRMVRRIQSTSSPLKMARVTHFVSFPRT